jgi:hypothetical protein
VCHSDLNRNINSPLKMLAMYAEEIVVVAFVVVVLVLAGGGKFGILTISARGNSLEEDNFRCKYSFFKSLNFQ